MITTVCGLEPKNVTLQGLEIQRLNHFATLATPPESPLSVCSDREFISKATFFKSLILEAFCLFIFFLKMAFIYRTPMSFHASSVQIKAHRQAVVFALGIATEEGDRPMRLVCSYMA